MYQLSISGFQCVAVCPVPRHRWRVETLERDEPVSAAKAGLFHVSDLFFTVKLVKLFKPADAYITKRHFN